MELENKKLSIRLLKYDYRLYNRIMLKETKTRIKAQFPLFYYLLQGMKREVTNRLMYPKLLTVELTKAKLTYQMIVTSIQEEVVVNGTYFERDLIERILGLIKPGNVFLDVGAATGTHSIPLAMKCGSEGQVYALEPDQECSVVLKKNLTLNGLNNVSVLNVAAWNKDTALILNTNGASGHAPQVEETIFQNIEFKTHLPISARSIESLVKSNDIRSPDIVKIDVEGKEYEVLQGMGDLKPKHIFVEVHPVMGVDLKKINEMMISKGYSIIDQQNRVGEIHIYYSIIPPN